MAVVFCFLSSDFGSCYTVVECCVVFSGLECAGVADLVESAEALRCSL